MRAFRCEWDDGSSMVVRAMSQDHAEQVARGIDCGWGSDPIGPPLRSDRPWSIVDSAEFPDEFEGGR